MLTGYDASFAALEDRCGVDMILVGDSLGNVLQGRTSTLPVTMEHMVYHTECVGHIVQRAMVVSDMPFGSYYESKEQTIRNAARLLALRWWELDAARVTRCVAQLCAGDLDALERQAANA